MATAQRQVHQLRVGAPSEVLARALLPRLEDALRCASLPDAGAQLLLVRRLHLGRVDAAATAQTLALAIEDRLRSVQGGWLQGETAGDATQASQVVFAGALEARVALVARLLRGQACTAWYWARAVPEWQPAAPAAWAAAAVLRTVASWPQARVALPAFCAGVVARTGAAALAGALPAALGVACCAAAGLPLQAAAHGGPAAAATATDGAACPPWLARLLSAAGGARAASAVDAPALRQPDAVASPLGPAQAMGGAAPAPDVDRTGPMPGMPVPPPWAALQGGLPTSPGEPAGGADSVAHPHERQAEPASARDPGHAAAGLQARAAVGAHLGHRPQARIATAQRPRMPPAGMTPDLGGQPTAHAGLLFLLPVLQRLGLPGWAASAGVEPRPCACAVLAAALQRLQADVGDPAWALCADAARAEPGLAPAPASWHSAALAAPRGRPAPALALALAQAVDPAAQASCWLQAARRWLRRGPRVGLATLVRRRGRVLQTPTHLDLVFRVGDADLRLRRHGLDIDPGWLPWFGRVVAYHYSDAAPHERP